MLDLDRLKELLAKATPGPWSVAIDDDGSPLSGRPSIIADPKFDCAIVHWDGFAQEHWRSARGDKEIHANAALIAAAVNALPSLISALEAERERAGKAERALLVVQNAAKTLANAQGTELEHLRQNAKFDHNARGQLEGLRDANERLTNDLEAIETRALAAEAEVAKLREAVRPFADIAERLPDWVLDGNGIKVSAGEARTASRAYKETGDA